MSSTHYFLRTENRSICHGSEFLNNISIARAGNFIMYVAAPFSWKQSIIVWLYSMASYVVTAHCKRYLYVLPLTHFSIPSYVGKGYFQSFHKAL